MNKIDDVLVEIEEITQNANIVKKGILNRLLFDGVITKKQYDEYLEKWQVIIIKDSWFKHWIKKFKAKEINPKAYSYKYVKFED